LVPNNNAAQQFVAFTFILQQQLSANVHSLAHNNRYPRSAIIASICFRQTTVLFAVDCRETRRFSLTISNFDFAESRRLLFAVSRYAACHSGWHVRGLHRVHVLPNIEQYWCLRICPHKHLSFADECQSSGNFMQSNTYAHCTLFIMHWRRFLTLRHFHGCHSETSSGRTMKLDTNVRGKSEGKYNWVRALYLLFKTPSYFQTNLEHLNQTWMEWNGMN
jgi:hypothetical protein